MAIPPLPSLSTSTALYLGEEVLYDTAGLVPKIPEDVVPETSEDIAREIPCDLTA